MKKPNSEPSHRDGERPYLFAYDITSDKRRQDVFKCLERWRVDGQYSVHETWLRSHQVHEISVELAELINRDDDSLMVCRLDQRHASPVYQMSVNHDSVPLLGKPRPGQPPKRFGDGWYLFCYDVRDDRRVQRVQKITVKSALYLQRSVYLYRGGDLATLLAEVYAEMEEDDDLRVYSIAGSRDMWFLDNHAPLLPEMQSQRGAGSASVWQRFLKWAKS